MKLMITLVFAGLSAGALAASNPVAESFSNAKLNIVFGERTRQLEATLQYQTNALVIADKKTTLALKVIRYSDVQVAEYCYSRYPRWETPVPDPPPLRLSSAKKHWILIQGNKGYSVIQLDKNNYKRVLAILEARVGTKVQTVADCK